MSLVVDSLIKWVEASPIQTEEAVEVAKCFWYLFNQINILLCEETEMDRTTGIILSWYFDGVTEVSINFINRLFSLSTWFFGIKMNLPFDINKIPSDFHDNI